MPSDQSGTALRREMSFEERFIGVESSDLGSEETHEGVKSRGLGGLLGRNRRSRRRDRWVKLEEKDRVVD